MKFHIIIDHPNQKSFNHAVLQAFTEGLKENNNEIDIIDLNQDGFNPIMSAEELAVYEQGISLDPIIKEYQDRLKAADHLVLIFPIWWNVMPVRLKGWLDKVLLPGFAVTEGHDLIPLLTDFTGATVLTTSASSDKFHRESTNNALDWVLCKGTLAFCGIKPINWLNFGEAGISDASEHTAWLQHIRDLGANF